jgi:hypothetical protein
MLTQKEEVVKFWGSSDDLIEVDGESFSNEICYGADSILQGVFRVIGPTGQAKVYVLYDSCWSFTFSKYEDEVPLPDWNARIVDSTENRYCAELHLTLPQGTAIVWEPQRER